MFDFLLQEEWWMETITASCITAVVTLFIYFIAYMGRLKEIERKLESLHGNKFDLLREDSKGLSQEHDKLERNLGEKLSDMGMRQDVLKDKVFEYINRENGRRESLASILPQQDVLSQIQLLYDKILVLTDENTKLKCQIQQLNEKLNHMHERDADEHQGTEQEKAFERAVEEIMSEEEIPEQEFSEQGSEMEI